VRPCGAKEDAAKDGRIGDESDSDILIFDRYPSKLLYFLFLVCIFYFIIENCQYDQIFLGQWVTGIE
jgi:hypothetical protein